MKWFKLFAVFALVVFAVSFAPHVAKADGPVIQKKSVESKVPRSGPGTSSVSKQYGNAKVTLTVWLRYYDYGNSEDVSGRVSAATTNVSASNVNYLEAGGTLLKGGYGGTQYPVDTGNIAHVTSVDTGWTAYYHGTNLLWIMSGHSYWDIWVGSYRWIDNVWADNSHQF